MKARRLGLAFAASAIAMTAPRAARAQDALYVQLEGGANVMLSSPQTDRYGPGGYLSGRLGLRLVGPVGVHGMAGYFNWTARDPQAGAAAVSPGTLTVFGGGVSLAPQLSPKLGRLSFEVDGGVGVTGAQGATRFVLAAGAGWLFPLARPLAVGVFARYNQLVTVDGDGNDARWFTAGLAVAFPGSPPPPEPPPPDADGDGVVDADDLCPAQPRGAHPDPARRGCPVGDRDGDGALDTDDRCPDVPAGPHPDARFRGCPGAAPAAACPPPPPATPCPACPQAPAVVVQVTAPTPGPTPAATPAPAPAAVIENGHININDSIYFDTGTATIQQRSFGVLDAVFSVMASHPEVLRVRVEGHTDDVGNARRNQRLSRDRARAVMRYLTQHGIPRERLSAEGYGSSRPAVQGATEDARARNRRVEFLILEGPGAAAGGGGDEDHGHHRRRHH
ncbi:MAG: OmpA family protein [Polyangiales bacterium]